MSLAIGILTVLSGLYAKGRGWTDEERIAKAIHRIESDTTSRVWERGIEVLARVPDDSANYRQAAAGLSDALRQRIELPYSDKEDVREPCELEASLVRANPRVIDTALRTLAALSDSVALPVVLDSVDLRGVNLKALSVGELYSRGSCLRGAKLPDLHARVADFTTSNLDDTDLTGAIIGHARFVDVVARGVKLGSVVVDSANFYNARLDSAVFALASFPLTLFTNATLTNAIFESACFYGSTFGGADLSRVQMWDSDVVYRKAYLGNVASGVPSGLKRLALDSGAVIAVLTRAEQTALRRSAGASYAHSAPRPTCKRATDESGARAISLADKR